MARNPFNHAPGTTTVSETVRDWLKFENIDKFNEAYVEEIAQGMLRRWQMMKGATEAEITGAADAKETGYRSNFIKFWKARGMDVDERAADTAWRKTRAKAAQRYYQLRMRASAPSLPSRPEPPPVEVEPIPDDELSPQGAAPQRSEQALEIMDIAQWMKYDAEVYSPELLHDRFYPEFLRKLTDALRQMSTDMAVRTYQIEQIHKLFEQKLFTMYCNRKDVKRAIADNPNAVESILENVQGWLDGQWNHIYGLAQKYK